MSVGTKAAALLAFVRVFDFALVSVKADWVPIVWAITILTIVGGNVMALVQSNVKRMLAYSSIAHAGYLLIGVVVGGIVGTAAVLFYLLCYAFLNTGAFGVVSLLERPNNSGLDASDLRGLWYRRPVLASFLAFFLLALAGFPPMAGFAAKYYLFYAALLGGHPELLIIGVLASVLGMYYYLRVIATMFMEGRETASTLSTVTATLYSAPPIPRCVSSKTGTSRTSEKRHSGGAATAVAVKPVKPGTTRVLKSPVAVKGVAEPEEPEKLAWISWIGIALAALGTLAMGTILPFWLLNLAQQAAPTLLK